jgi:hypothetical protein
MQHRPRRNGADRDHHRDAQALQVDDRDQQRDGCEHPQVLADREHEPLEVLRHQARDVDDVLLGPGDEAAEDRRHEEGDEEHHRGDGDAQLVAGRPDVGVVVSLDDLDGLVARDGRVHLRGRQQLPPTWVVLVSAG